MDQQINNKNSRYKRYAIYLLIACVPVVLISWAVGVSGKRSVEVEGRQLMTTIASVQPFEERISADGFVVPIESFMIDAVIGGKVIAKHTEDGALLEVGDTILTLENTDLELDILNRETAVLDMMTNIRHTRNLLDQAMVSRQSEFAEVHYQWIEAKRIYEMNASLVANEVISPQEWQETVNRLNYLTKREALLKEAVKRDSIVGKSQLNQMEISLVQAKKNLELMRKKLDDLVIRAPVNGQLSSFNLEVGRLITPGTQIAQVDLVDGFKMRVNIDQHHSQKLAVGQNGYTEINGQRYEAVVQKIYPTVVNNQFTADLHFSLDHPEHLKRGQNITARITLSAPRETLTLKKGSFFQETGGQWVYVVDRLNNRAVKRNITLGRHNTDHFEVLEGLDAGEEVIISGYHEFKDYDQLNLNL